MELYFQRFHTGLRRQQRRLDQKLGGTVLLGTGYLPLFHRRDRADRARTAHRRHHRHRTHERGQPGRGCRPVRIPPGAGSAERRGAGQGRPEGRGPGAERRQHRRAAGDPHGREKRRGLHRTRRQRPDRTPGAGGSKSILAGQQRQELFPRHKRPGGGHHPDGPVDHGPQPLHMRRSGL